MQMKNLFVLSSIIFFVSCSQSKGNSNGVGATVPIAFTHTQLLSSDSQDAAVLIVGSAKLPKTPSADLLLPYEGTTGFTLTAIPTTTSSMSQFVVGIPLCSALYTTLNDANTYPVLPATIDIYGNLHVTFEDTYSCSQGPLTLQVQCYDIIGHLLAEGTTSVNCL